MNAIDLLEGQHEEVAELFDKIEGTDEKREKRQLFEKLAGKLVGHDAIEREIFYPACEDALGSEDDQLGEALVEHGVVEFCLYQADQALGGDDFDAKVTVLKEVIEHHVEEEEKELFPKVKKAMGDGRLEELGAAMEERFEQALEEDFREPLHANLRQVLAGATKTRPAARAPAPRPAAAKKAARPKKAAKRPPAKRRAAAR